MEVTGELTVTLYASSTAKDTDFTAKLLDVYPSGQDYPAGFDMNLEDGIIRARFRDSLKVEKLMLPGQVYKFTIKMYPTGEPLNEHRRMIVADNTIYHDKARPSHIALPLIPINK